MSQQLLFFESDQDPEQEVEEPASHFVLRLNDAVAQTLLENFRTAQNICPVLSVGNSSCGRSAVLDALVRKGQLQDPDMEPETEDATYFESEGRQSGVYIWPKPVRIGSVTLLLIKMWGIDFREGNEALKTMCEKVLVALLSITSVCLVCAEKGNLTHFVSRIHELYSKAKEALSLEVSKFVVFAESQSQLSRPNMKAFCLKLQSEPLGPMTQWLFRGDRGISESCLEELCNLLTNPELHLPFITTHQAVLPTLNAGNLAEALLVIFRALVKTANLDLEFSSFLDHVPKFVSSEFEEQMKNLEDIELSMQLVQNGQALDFFIEDSYSYGLNAAVIETLQEKYDLQKPTVVMVIIGNPGMGKSTLLNHIVKVSTGSRVCGELFKTGNTGAHTTKASQVFSQPLKLGDSQLMLMDLEGLGGVEVVDQRLAVLQENLVSAILTVASVPCILVRNEIQCMQFVEKVIARLCMLKDNFGFLMERVHLLFQDRDTKPGECDNPHFLKYIETMNQQYFEGRPVLVLRNKPNFSVCEKSEMCEAFLKDLLNDSSFVKCNQSGSVVNIAQLLVEMQYIMGHQNTNLQEIRLSIEEGRRRNMFELPMTSDLQLLSDTITCPEESMSLITIFNEKFRKFMGECEEQLQGESVNVQKYVKTTLSAKADLHRLNLAQIEYCYRAVKAMSVIDLRDRVTEQLEYYYREAWWINTFIERSEELKQKLEQIGQRYPQEQSRLRGVLEDFEHKQANLRNWFLANYGFQIATTAATGGLGIAAKGATLAVTAARFGIAAALSGAAAVGRFAYGATTRLSIIDTAVELYRLKNKRVKLNPKVSMPLRTDTDVRILVLMVIGTKRMRTSYLLNEFVRHVSPFTASSLQAFNDSKLTQTIHFSYQRPDFQNEGRATSCHGFIIYLRMKKNMSKPACGYLKKLATALISRVSFTCIFVDRPEQYAESIITDAFQPVAQSQEWQSPTFTPKIAAFYQGSNKRLSFIGKLLNIGVPNMAVPIDRFDEQGMKSALVTVKSEFDVSSLMTASGLLAALELAEVETNSRV